MLAQLVCIDRRYQRMNCFNIRELQSILKRRYFTDLVNSSDYTTLLNNSVINLRYKLNTTNLIEHNTLLFQYYNLTTQPKDKTISFINTKFHLLNYPKLNSQLNLKDLVTKLLELFLTPTTLLLTNLKALITNVSLWSLVNIRYNLAQTPIAISASFNFNTPTLYFNKSIDTDVVFQGPKQSIYFNSRNTGVLGDTTGYNLVEFTNSLRFTRFFNPIISYSYKTGHYIGIWDKLYPSLFTMFIEQAKATIKAS